MDLLYIAIGLAIGIISGFFGLGGGFILTPVLMLFGYPPIVAIATSLLYSIGTSISGVVAHLRLKNIYWKTAITLGISGVLATQAANPLVVYMSNHHWDKIVIPVLYIVLMGYFCVQLLVKRRKKEQDRGATRHAFSLPKTLLIGFVSGFLSSTLGVGGGFVMVPLMISILKIEPRKAVGTSLVSVFAIVSAGFITYAQTVSLNYHLGLFLIIGALFGAQAGARLTALYNNQKIEMYLGGIYGVTLLSVTFQLFGIGTIGLYVVSLYILFLLCLFLKDTVRHFRKKTRQSA
ncbi:putative permease with tauE sulfite export domain [Fictibacillus macauensis ZFHKF-1]|uniref:Probable membrane transporter protein n=1 Tax=Fictibacillus macauensis ZFHKF-1 TaxID=1196324 RepID=I8UJF5_9BACL|nr:sulfite exporter TauE/SafE family protein [Fictibacillus macauensis]EIT86995.1 putative permease with tauE sulfite export domain [Fictibacillus macauensis ZFHKF-1]